MQKAVHRHRPTPAMMPRRVSLSGAIIPRSINRTTAARPPKALIAWHRRGVHSFHPSPDPLEFSPSSRDGYTARTDGDAEQSGSAGDAQAPYPISERALDVGSKIEMAGNTCKSFHSVTDSLNHARLLARGFSVWQVSHYSCFLV